MRSGANPSGFAGEERPGPALIAAIASHPGATSQLPGLAGKQAFCPDRSSATPEAECAPQSRSNPVRTRRSFAWRLVRGGIPSLEARA